VTLALFINVLIIIIIIYSYRSSIDTVALNCLVFEKIAFLCILATDGQTNRQTDKQMDSADALSRSRYRERRLNK